MSTAVSSRLSARQLAFTPARPSPDAVLLAIGGKRASRLRRALKWVLVPLLLGAGGLGASSYVNRPPPEPEYRTAPVTVGDIVLTVSATGSLQPKGVVSVGGEISGRVASVAVDFNDRVAKGQVLATLDTESLDNALEEAEASLAVAKADVTRSQSALGEAKSGAERAARLARQGLISKEEEESFEAANVRAKADYTAARAQRLLAEIRVQQAKTDRARALIVSPIDGIVLSRSVEPGNAISASLEAPEMFLLAEDLAQMELHLGIDEADVGRVEVGQAATFTVDAWPGREFEATVASVYLSPTTTETVVTYTAVLTVANTDGVLRPGMTATATITTGEQDDVMRVTNAALRFEPTSQKEKEAKPAQNPLQPTIRAGGRGGAGGRGKRPNGGAEGPARQDNGGRGSVWVLRDSEPTRIAVGTGASDGTCTAIVSDALEPGDEVLVGMEVSQ